MTKTYKGLYCSICDYENVKYFDKKKMIITYSEKFCRSIVEKTLPSLLLFHVDIVKLANLTTRMVTQCDFRGLFDVQGSMPPEQIFSVQEDYVTSLKGCAENRNNDNWFGYCKDVCMNFNIAQYSPFFEPNVN